MKGNARYGLGEDDNMVSLAFALLVHRVNDLSVRLKMLEKKVDEIQRQLDYVIKKLNELSNTR